MHNPGVWQTLVRISETWPSANNSFVVKKKRLLRALLVFLLWFYKLWNKKTAAPFGPRNKQTVTCDSLLFLGTKIFKKEIFFPCKNFLAAVFLSATAWSSCTTLPGSCLRLRDTQCIRVQPVVSCLRVQRFKQTNCVFQTSVMFFSGLAWHFLHGKHLTNLDLALWWFLHLKWWVGGLSIVFRGFSSHPRHPEAHNPRGVSTAWIPSF